MLTQADIQERIVRYGVLRSALRAIEASCQDGSAFGLEGGLQQIRACLAELRQPGEASTQRIGTPEELDRMLDDMQRAIVDQIRAIPLSQLRATLPAIKRQNPEELKALLDVCLLAHTRGSPWWSLVDYLITLLAYDEKGGRRYVARDPTRLTPLLENLCAVSDRDKSEFTDALAELFHKARVEVERGIPAGPIIAQMRSAKHQAMETLLIPAILQAVTAYNVAVSNQRAELIETQRVLEQAELEAFEKSLGSRVQQGGSELSPIEPFEGSALDSPQLRRVVEALGSRLRGEGSGEGPEWQVATPLDLSKLSAYEAGALRETDPRPVLQLVATAVTVGLIEKNLGELGDHLTRAGISAEQLRSQWAPELENRVRSEAAELVSGDAYEEARHVARVRARLVQQPTEESHAWRLERDAAQCSPTAYARPHRAVRSTDKDKPLGTLLAAVAVSWRALAASVVCAAVLAIGASFFFTGGKNTKVAFFSEKQLREISPYVESGYRNGKGEGPAFVGTLGAQWEQLPASEREASGQAIEKALLAQGVSEFMFFDKKRRLKLQYAEGRLAVH